MTTAKTSPAPRKTARATGKTPSRRPKTSATEPVRLVLSRLHDVRETADGWTARCPAHEDRNPSLGITEGADGRALLHCFAGCSLASIIRALGIDELDLFPRSEPAPERSWIIRDADGNEVAVHHRVDRPEGKAIWWTRNGAKGLAGLHTRDLPLYGAETLNALPDGETVVVCEGEPAADAIRAAGLHAVGTVCGAAVTPSPATLAPLPRFRLTLWPDADAAGREHMAAIARLLDGAALRWVSWPDAPDKGDAANTTPDHVRVLVADAVEHAPAETPEADADETPFIATEGANARRLARIAVGKLRHATGWGWVGWDGRRWARDEHRAWDLLRTLPAMIADEAVADLDGERRKALYRWAGVSESRRTQANTLDLATHEPAIRCESDIFNRDPLALTCLSGTINLATGTLRPHDPADLISQLAPVEYDPDATSPILDSYLATVAGGDSAFVDYLQRAIGLTLTGSTSEEVFFLLLGPTCTGKTTLVEALLHLLGDYGLKSAMESFLAQPRVGLQARGDLAAMQGARLIAACEAPATKDLAAILVKELVGGDSITARRLYQEEFTFRPVGKLWLAANDCPRISDRDGAVWRRLRRIPFENPIVNPDPSVKKALGDPSTEAARALFAWAVRGAVAWHRDGLGSCARVDGATADLRRDMDPLRQFYAECVEFSPEATVPGKMLRAAYISWAEANGIRGHALVGNREWSERLIEKGCEQGRTTLQGAKTRVWYGVRLCSDGSGEVTS
jgi:putative DNA primase/helicase